MVESSSYSRNVMQRKQLHYSPNLINTTINAIDHGRVVTIEYDSYTKGVSIRDIEPMALVFKEGKRNIVGWCRLRNDYRSFRLDKLVTVKLRNERFGKRDDFNIENFQDDPSAVYHEEYEVES